MEWFSDSILFNIVLFFLCGLVFLYYYGTSTYGYWRDLGVIYEEPVPFFGTTFSTMFSFKTTHGAVLERYKKFKGHKFVGTYTFRKPSITILDPELIESILIKDFNVFYNRGIKVDTKLDPLAEHLVNLEDAKWKNLRNKLTPTFSSGKLKGMQQQLVDCSTDLINCMKDYESKSFETRELMAKFATDVISSCAFGLSTKVMNDPDSEFRKIGKKVFEISTLARLRLALRSQYPWLLKLLKWKSVPEKMENFFIKTIKDTIAYREKNGIERHDFLHLMNELRKQDMANNNKDQSFVFTDSLMAANAFVFFVAGFETTSSTLSYALYELSINDDIQDKAFREVESAYKKHGSELTFEAIKEMSYLENIINETLRRYPPAPSTARVASHSYTIPGSSLVIPKGTSVQIPIYGLHHDPDYFPDPFKFDPDRFDAKTKKGTYLPFGDGPRICIGMRFAEMEIKVALARILLEYKLLPSKVTKTPLQYRTGTIFLVPVGGLWIDIEKRNR